MTLRDEIGRDVGRIRHVICAPSRFADKLGWWVDGKEFFHFEGPYEADVRLTRKVISARRAELKAEPRVSLGGTDWVRIRFRRRSDSAFVLEFARAAAEANARPSSGARSPMRQR